MSESVRHPGAILAPNVVLSPDVVLSSDAVIGAFCVIGTDGPPGSAPPTFGPRVLLRSHTVIYRGSTFGADFQTGHHVLVRDGSSVGAEVSIGTGTVVEHSVQIGDRVRLHSGVFVPEFTVLESECWIGPRVVFTNAPYPRCPDVSACTRGVVVRRGARIGANATLLPGVSVGEGALVGAGSVVTRDVEPGVVVAGNPARTMRKVSSLVCPVGLLHEPYPGVGSALLQPPESKD